MHFAKRHPIFVVFILIVVLGFVVTLFIKTRTKEEVEHPPRGVMVEVEEVRFGTLTRKVTAIGTLAANQSIKIQPEVSGLISKVHFTGGEAIRAGTPIIEIDDRVIQAELKEVKAKNAAAKREYERIQKLISGKFSSLKALDVARSEFLSTQATVESAEARLTKTVIRAPFDGVIGLHRFSVGDPVSPQTEIADFVDITPIKVNFQLPAQYVRFISIAQHVAIQVDGFGEDKFPGLIEAIDATVDPISHSISVRAITPNKNFMLKPGLFARVEVVVGSKENALIIPEEAVDTDGEQEFVFRVVEGIAFKVPILTGIKESGNVEILRGLQEGDRVITVGVMKIRNGYPVRYIFEGKEYDYNEEFWKKQREEAETKEGKKKKEEGTNPKSASAKDPSKEIDQKGEGSPENTQQGASQKSEDLKAPKQNAPSEKADQSSQNPSDSTQKTQESSSSDSLSTASNPSSTTRATTSDSSEEKAPQPNKKSSVESGYMPDQEQKEKGVSSALTHQVLFSLSGLFSSLKKKLRTDS